jgi:hypothetical protein
MGLVKLAQSGKAWGVLQRYEEEPETPEDDLDITERFIRSARRDADRLAKRSIA